MRVQELREPIHLQSVKSLWRTNSATLGFLPEGAFEQYAVERTILVALDDQAKCIGYLLYRISRDRVVTIHHLCVDSKARRQGVAKCLVDSLKAITKDCLGIKLACRRDYEASRIWPRLGFVAEGSRQGRGHKSKELTVWWFDHGHPNLFTLAAKRPAESRLRVVIDANVFFDLHGRNGAEESRALLADWLQDAIELHVTDELLNEINRNENSSDRGRELRMAQGYPRVVCDALDFEKAQNSILPIFPEHMTESDWSDLRHLARTIGSGDAQFFVTRDTALVERVADEIYEGFGVSVITPANLICRLDELRRETEYEGRRLAGTLSTIRRVQGGEELVLTQHFQQTRVRETKAGFQQRLRQYLAEPDRYACLIAQDTQDLPIAVIVFDRAKSRELQIPLLRIKPSPLAGTLARHFVFYAVVSAAKEERMIVRVVDSCLDESVRGALQEDFFIETQGGWLKVGLPVLEDARLLAERLSVLCSESGQELGAFSELASVLRLPSAAADARNMFDIERVLWPAKIADAHIPTFIVPIKPAWAYHLFDEQLANQTLFGARPELALSREGVYYRSSRFPGGVRAPGRILWYVSNDPRYHGTKQIRACSRLDEVVVGKASDLYKRFRRLGIYTWDNVLRVAKKNPEQEIMALRFSDTELFANPVPIQTVRQIISATGVAATFQSPIEVSPRGFAKIYLVGQRLAERKPGDE